MNVMWPFHPTPQTKNQITQQSLSPFMHGSYQLSFPFEQQLWPLFAPDLVAHNIPSTHTYDVLFKSIPHLIRTLDFLGHLEVMT